MRQDDGADRAVPRATRRAGAAAACSALVALTFTEKAARELRQRIRSSASERLLAGATWRDWRAVLRGLEAAPIGTFHEFCGQLLRRHALEAGIDPDFAILDASIAGTVRDEALRAASASWLAERDADLIDLAVEYGLRQVREALAGLISERVAGRLADWEGRGADEVVAIWKAVWEETAAADAPATRRARRAPLPRAAGRERVRPPEDPRTAGASLLEALPSLERLRRPGPDARRDPRDTRVQGGGTAKHWPSPEIYEDGQGQVRGVPERDRRRPGNNWSGTRRPPCWPPSRPAVRPAGARRGRRTRGQAPRGGLDFDDLLIRTRDLLRDHAAAVRDAPRRARSQRVLVDEFQDTDPVQSEILGC